MYVLYDIISVCAGLSCHAVQVAGVCSSKMGLWRSSATWCGWATPSTMSHAPGTTAPFIVEQENATTICCSCFEKNHYRINSPCDSHSATLALAALVRISTQHGSCEALCMKQSDG